MSDIDTNEKEEKEQIKNNSYENNPKKNNNISEIQNMSNILSNSIHKLNESINEENENHKKLENSFNENLMNYFDNLDKNTKHKKTTSQENEELNESIFDLKDKNFLNKLSYLTKKQKILDKLGDDCFIEIDEKYKETENENFDEDLADLIDLYKNKENKFYEDENNISIKMSDKSLINFNLNTSKLTITNNPEDSLLYKEIPSTENSFLKNLPKIELKINLINEIDTKERQEIFDFNKINEIIIKQEKKTNQLKTLGEEYNMQNEEIQGEYLQLSQRKKYFLHKDQNLRNFSIVLNVQSFKNPIPIGAIGNFNLDAEGKKRKKIKQIFEEIEKENDKENLDKNLINENYKECFNFNKFEILDCYDNENKEIKKRKINSNLLNRLKFADKKKLLKNFIKENELNKEKENQALNKEKIYKLVDEICDKEITKENNNNNNKISFEINFPKLKKNFDKVITNKLLEKNEEEIVDEIFAVEIFIENKIKIWNKLSNDSDEKNQIDIFKKANPNITIKNEENFSSKYFNNFFLKIFEKKEKKIKEKNTEIDFFAIENPQENSNSKIFGEKISISNEKLLEILKGNLTEIEETEMENIKSIQDLILKCENLTEIFNLKNFENLKKIDFGSNKLSSLDFLNSLDNEISNKINLSNSKFLQFSNKLENILELNFCQNKIKSFDKKIFEKLINLRVLNLEINEITKIENLINCKELVSLNINYNKIEKIENLGNLGKLEKLFLKGNLIKKIENLYLLKKLKVISLGINKLKDIDNIEDELLYVEELTLFKNKIKSLPENFSLPFLRFLYLNSNKIKQISNFFCPNLEEIYLQENKISGINASKKMVKYCAKLKKVDLSFNKFEGFSEIISHFEACRNIEVINLTNNPFYINLNKTISVEKILKRIFKGYKSSDINFNNKNKDNNKNNNNNNNNNNKNFQKEFSFEENSNNKTPEESERLIDIEFLSEKNEENDKEFSLLGEIFAEKEKKFLRQEQKMKILYNFFNQQNNFQNIFNSKFAQSNFFGKFFDFEKNISFEKFNLLDIFNSKYYKDKINFLKFLENKKKISKKNLDFFHYSFNKEKINEENFRKYIFALRKNLEFLDFYSPRICENFRGRKKKVLKLQNKFRGFLLRKKLHKENKGFCYFKNLRKILKIQTAFRASNFRRKFLYKYKNLKLIDDDENNEKIPNFFLDDDNINFEDSFMKKLNAENGNFVDNDIFVIKEENEDKDNKSEKTNEQIPKNIKISNELNIGLNNNYNIINKAKQINLDLSEADDKNNYNDNNNYKDYSVLDTKYIVKNNHKSIKDSKTPLDLHFVNMNINQNLNNKQKLPNLKHEQKIPKIKSYNNLNINQDVLDLNKNKLPPINHIKINTANSNKIIPTSSANSLRNSQDSNYSINSKVNSQKLKLEKSRINQSPKRNSDHIYVHGKLLPMKIVEEIRLIENECRLAIINGKKEWDLQNPIAEQLLVKRIKKEFKKRIEKILSDF